MSRSNSSEQDDSSSADGSNPTGSSSGHCNGKVSNKASKSGTRQSAKPRLSFHQKNTNHKEAENKRRNAIREQFIALSTMVENGEGLERSENLMLKKVVTQMKREITERRGLLAIYEQRGLVVPGDLRLSEKEYGGREWQQQYLEEWCKTKGIRLEDLEPEADGDDEWADQNEAEDN